MDICGLLLAGAVIGALARLIVPGSQPIGFFVTILIGVLGSVGGDAIARQSEATGATRWLIALGVATVLVLLVSAGQRWAARNRR